MAFYITINAFEGLQTMSFRSGSALSPNPGLDLWLRRLILILGLPLLFLPKLNIVEVAKDSAGLRIDDVILLLLVPLVALAVAIHRRPSVSRAECAFVVMMAIFLVSNAFNIAVYGYSNPLYAVRLAEYFLFYYIGAYSGPILAPLCYALIGLNGVVMVLQAFGVVGGFYSEGYGETASTRPIGLTGGPWEIAAVINIVFATLLYQGKRNHWLLFVPTFALLLLSGARSPALIHLLVLAVFLFRRSRRKGVLVFRGAVVAVVGVAALLLIPNKVVERSKFLFTTENVKLAQQIYERTELLPQFTSFESIGGGEESHDEESDRSWILRVTQWMYAYKQWSTTPSAWVIGLGPGMWGPSLDGGWLRLLTETGVVGLAAFVLFFNTLCTTPLLKAVRFCLYLNMAFIDIYISYKTMALVFLIAGATVGAARLAEAARPRGTSAGGELGAATPG